MIKIKGSGSASGSEFASESGSISQRHGSADPDPQHRWQVPVIRMMLGLELLSGRGAAGGSPFSPALSGNLIWTSNSRVTVCTFEPFAPITVLKKARKVEFIRMIRFNGCRQIRNFFMRLFTIWCHIISALQLHCLHSSVADSWNFGSADPYLWQWIRILLFSSLTFKTATKMCFFAY